MRVVLDTNVFISGIFWQGNFSSFVIDSWHCGKFILITSMKIIEELIQILRGFKIQMTEEVIEEWKNMITQNSILVEPRISLNIIKADHEDNKFIEAAVEGNAEYIVSQDRHLLDLNGFKGISIVNPEAFLKIIEEKI